MFARRSTLILSGGLLVGWLSPARAGTDPPDVIDPNSPAVITDGGCFTTEAAIEHPLDVDVFRVRVTTVPPAGLQLAAYAGGDRESSNALLRVFTEDGTELANNDSDGRPYSWGTGPGGAADCPPLPGVNPLVSVPITAPGNYYVAVSGGGCDTWDLVNCVPAPGECNNNYNPFVPNSGTAGIAGPYHLTVGLGSLTPAGIEPDDSMPLATLATNIGVPGAFLAVENGFMGDGPFGACLGDFDYWRVPGSELTPGNALDAQVISNVLGVDSSSVMMVYEKVGSNPHILVAANDNTVGSRDSRCLVPIRAGADYFVMVGTTGYRPQTIDGWFRMFGGATEFEPGLNQQVPGAGDAIPGALNAGLGPVFDGQYDLRITEIPLPPETGPFEPNDSLTQASANARIEVPPNIRLRVSVEAVLGDGRYGWSHAAGGPLGDTELFELTGLVPGGTVECTATPHATNETALFIYFFQGESLHDFTDLRLMFLPTGGISAQLLTPVPAEGPYYVLVSPDDDRALSFIGIFAPWDVTIPGTLLNGQYSGPYTLSVRSRSLPPRARPQSRMWGASRGSGTNQDILELDPDTGLEVNRLPAPATVNGAATGLAVNPDATVLYYMNGPGTGGMGTLLWELDPNDGTVLLPNPPDLCQDPLIGNNCTSLDGLGWAGQHLWMCAQTPARVYRWNPTTRRATASFTAGSMGLTSFRDGLDGTDQSNLGTGHVIYVADRNGRRIAAIDVGPAGRGPAGDDVFVLLGTIPDPTWDGGPGIANTGGLAVLRTLGGSPFQNLYAGNINATLLHVVDADPAAAGNLVGGWIYPDFGCSGLTAWNPLPGDLDGDGDVDLSDFVLFQLCFAGSNNPPAGTCPPGVDADLDGDGDVDLADFLIFQQNFTGSQ